MKKFLIDLFLVLLFTLIICFITVVVHEADLSENFYSTGDAKCFFFPIKIDNYNKSIP